MTIEDELKSALAGKTLIVGTREVMKILKGGAARSIILSSNAPTSVSRDAKHYAGLTKIPIHVFPGTSAQLGTFLGRPFGVAACAIKAETKK
ncbi:MAG: ribosomal L7Ae/L30e/S12e/Gadd45 family protein [Candidatus Aenigmatarchaeota archaeon]